MKAVVLEGDALLISRQALGKMVDFKTIDKGIERFRNRESQSWKFKKIGGSTWIYYDSISTKTLKKLPSKDEILLREVDKQESEKEEKQSRVVRVLRGVYLNSWKDYAKEFGEVRTQAMRIKYAKKYALLLKISKLMSKGVSKMDCFNALETLKIELLPKHYANFTTTLKGFESEGISYVFHGNLENKNAQRVEADLLSACIWKVCGNPHFHKLTQEVQLYEVNNLLTYIGQKEISLSTLKHYLNDKGLKNRVLSTGNKDVFEKKVKGYLNRDKLHYAFAMVEIDGSSSQVPYLDEKDNKVRQANIFVAMDYASQKILAYDISKHEVFENTSNVLRKIYYQYGCLPKQVVSDNFAYNKKEELAEKLQYQMRFAKVGNPKAKKIERCFMLNSLAIQATHPTFNGRGIKDKVDTKTPSREYATSQRTTDNIMTYKEFEKWFSEVVSMYNNKPLESLAGLSPNEMFEVLPKEVTSIEPYRYALGLGGETVVDVRNGFVRMVINKKEYAYRLDYKNQLDLTGKQVRVVYAYEDLQTIYLVDSGDNLICEAKTAERVHPQAESPIDVDNLSNGIAKVEGITGYLEGEKEHFESKIKEKTGIDLKDYKQGFDKYRKENLNAKEAERFDDLYNKTNEIKKLHKAGKGLLEPAPREPTYDEKLFIEMAASKEFPDVIT